MRGSNLTSECLFAFLSGMAAASVSLSRAANCESLSF
jgi:hypothetical protein